MTFNRVTGSPGGFVLASVLWLLAAITILASLFAAWVNSSLEKVYLQEQTIAANIEQSGTKSAVLYLLATNLLNSAGLSIEAENAKSISSFSLDPGITGNEMRLDDTVYSGLGRASFSIQDEGGLFGINKPSPLYLENLLGILGIPASMRGSLADKLLDYQDSDDLLRLNGAEAPDYERSGLPSPANYSLLTTRETMNILGWDKEKELWKDDLFPRLTTIATGGIPNFNTAPPSVLKIITGMDEDAAEKIVLQRKTQPLLNLTDAEKITGKRLSLDPMETSFFPSSNLRITLWHDDVKLYQEIHLKLTTQPASKAPWLIDHEVKAPLIDNFKSSPKETLETIVFTSQNSSV